MIGAKPNLVSQQRVAAKNVAVNGMTLTSPSRTLANGTGGGFVTTTTAIIPPETPVSNSVTRK